MRPWSEEGGLGPVYLRMNAGRRPVAAQEVSRPAVEPAFRKSCRRRRVQSLTGKWLSPATTTRRERGRCRATASPWRGGRIGSRAPPSRRTGLAVRTGLKKLAGTWARGQSAHMARWARTRKSPWNVPAVAAVTASGPIRSGAGEARIIPGGGPVEGQRYAGRGLDGVEPLGESLAEEVGGQLDRDRTAAV